MTRLGLVCLVILITGLQLTSQTPTFEVVSIRENTSAGPPSVPRPASPDGSFTATGRPVRVLMALAFESTENVAGLPDWTTAARFDVSAKASTGVGNITAERRRAMMRALLADRFKLKTHYETRDVPAYDLVLDRSDGRLVLS